LERDWNKQHGTLLKELCPLGWSRFRFSPLLVGNVSPKNTFHRPAFSPPPFPNRKLPRERPVFRPALVPLAGGLSSPMGSRKSSVPTMWPPPLDARPHGSSAGGCKGREGANRVPCGTMRLLRNDGSTAGGGPLRSCPERRFPCLLFCADGSVDHPLMRAVFLALLQAVSWLPLSRRMSHSGACPRPIFSNSAAGFVVRLRPAVDVVNANRSLLPHAPAKIALQ